MALVRRGRGTHSVKMLPRYVGLLGVAKRGSLSWVLHCRERRARHSRPSIVCMLDLERGRDITIHTTLHSINN